MLKYKRDEREVRQNMTKKGKGEKKGKGICFLKVEIWEGQNARKKKMEQKIWKKKKEKKMREKKLSSSMVKIKKDEKKKKRKKNCQSVKKKGK